MKAMMVLQVVMVCVLTSFMNTTLADQKALPPKYDEFDLKKRYETFLLELDYVKVATDYPKVIKGLLSGNSARQVTAVKLLGELGEPAVIPWLVTFLDSEDALLRIWAGSSIDKVISACVLKRRDRTQSDRVVLRLPEPGEYDLRPFAWVALKMFRKPDDGNTHAHAASVTRYLEVREFEDELQRCLRSRHPAVSEKAKWALQSLGLKNTDEKAQPDGLANRRQPTLSELSIQDIEQLSFMDAYRLWRQEKESLAQANALAMSGVTGAGGVTDSGKFTPTKISALECRLGQEAHLHESFLLKELATNSEVHQILETSERLCGKYHIHSMATVLFIPEHGYVYKNNSGWVSTVQQDLWLKAMNNKASPDDPANGSQPIRSETNQTSSAAGSRR